MATESKPIEMNTLLPDFSVLATDGHTYSAKSFERAKVLVVGFTCNHCPYVQAYEQRLVQLVKDFASRGVDFLCINSNDDKAYPDDSFEKMKERYKSQSFNFIYARDESQNIAKVFNAACTPEFYVYDESRRLQYHGRLDDNHKDPAQVKVTFLRNAIEDLLSKRQVQTAQTAALGCSIKWK